MPTPRPKRATRRPTRLGSFHTCDKNGEWVFETPVGGDRPKAEGKPNAQETSAEVRGIETPIDVQVIPDEIKNGTPLVGELSVNQIGLEISVTENISNSNVVVEGQAEALAGKREGDGVGERSGGLGRGVVGTKSQSNFKIYTNSIIYTLYKM